MAFHNLVGNALKYSGGKPVSISARGRTITICDSGIGIPEADLPHVFEPFFRASNTSSVSGHGVGLSLARAILERHGARLSVSSKQGKGTTVTVVFK